MTALAKPGCTIYTEVTDSMGDCTTSLMSLGINRLAHVAVTSIIGPCPLALCRQTAAGALNIMQSYCSSCGHTPWPPAMGACTKPCSRYATAGYCHHPACYRAAFATASLHRHAAVCLLLPCMRKCSSSGFLLLTAVTCMRALLLNKNRGCSARSVLMLPLQAVLVLWTCDWL